MPSMTALLHLPSLPSLAWHLRAHCPLGRTAAQHGRSLLDCCNVLRNLHEGQLRSMHGRTLPLCDPNTCHTPSCASVAHPWLEMQLCLACFWHHLCAAVSETLSLA